MGQNKGPGKVKRSLRIIYNPGRILSCNLKPKPLNRTQIIEEFSEHYLYSERYLLSEDYLFVKQSMHLELFAVRMYVYTSRVLCTYFHFDRFVVVFIVVAANILKLLFIPTEFIK
uniref:Uncharacterized protein n=1 Tax=Glossina brevipalpis TaxID=37001 RepID=A0A1A9WEP8_9MUSC